MPFWQLLKSPYQYFKNRNGILCELKLNLRWEQWSNSLIWQLFENLPKIKYFLAYINRSIGPTIKIILSVQDNFCQDFCHCPTNLWNDYCICYITNKSVLILINLIQIRWLSDLFEFFASSSIFSKNTWFRVTSEDIFFKQPIRDKPTISVDIECLASCLCMCRVLMNVNGMLPDICF
jgi:hypothetical protein